MSTGAPLVVSLLAAIGCAGNDAPEPGETAKGLTRDELVRVEVESECERLRAGAQLDRLDEFREAALARLGKTRNDRNQSLSRFASDAEANREIATKVVECRRATGWIAEPRPEGNPTWVRSDR